MKKITLPQLLEAHRNVLDTQENLAFAQTSLTISSNVLKHLLDKASMPVVKEYAIQVAHMGGPK